MISLKTIMVVLFICFVFAIPVVTQVVHQMVPNVNFASMLSGFRSSFVDYAAPEAAEGPGSGGGGAGVI